MNTKGRLHAFVDSFEHIVADRGVEERLLAQGKAILSELIRHDDWLPDKFARPSPERYQQYLLHCDPLKRFSVVSFVWGPGQTTPVHDHTVWGMVGVMRGAEVCEEFDRDVATGRLQSTGSHLLPAGAIDLVSPRIGDIHRVSNALADRVSISIHVYGADIGAVKRHVFDADTGAMKDFVSGYSEPY